VGRNPSVKSIVLNGSVASGLCKYFVSDIDISIILKGDADLKKFQKQYKVHLRFIAFICPFILPIEERLRNIYFENDLSSSEPNMYRGYLNNTPFKILFGEFHLEVSNKLDKTLFIEDKIYQLVKSKKVAQTKIKEITSFTQEEETTSLTHSIIKKLHFIKTPSNQFLQYPILTGNNEHIYHYDTMNELLLGASRFEKIHRFIGTMHIYKSWLIYIDDEIKVMHQDRLPSIISGEETSFNVENEFFIKSDMKSLHYYFLDGLTAYEPLEPLDNLNKRSLKYVGEYINLYMQDNSSSIGNLTDAIKVISGNDQGHLTLSLCVCTKNRNSELKDLLQSVETQTKAPDEILLINNGIKWEDDFEAELRKNLKSNVRIFHSDLNTISALRNLCLIKAESDVVSFVDDDCVLEESWVSKVYDHFSSDPSLSLLGGTVQHFRQDKSDLNEMFHRSYLEETL